MSVLAEPIRWPHFKWTEMAAVAAVAAGRPAHELSISRPPVGRGLFFGISSTRGARSQAARHNRTRARCVSDGSRPTTTLARCNSGAQFGAKASESLSFFTRLPAGELSSWDTK